MSERTRFAALDEATGRPDGGSCDAEGFYWSAGVSAGRLNRFAPDGELVESYPVPVRRRPCHLRRAGFPHALSDQPARGPCRGCSREGAVDRRPFAAPAPVAGFPAWRFLDI